MYINFVELGSLMLNAKCQDRMTFGSGVCGTVSSRFSGLETRSLGLNTLGTTKSPTSSQSVHVGRPSTASWV